MVLDTACIKINKESLADIVTKYKSIVGNIHISEKNLNRINKTKLNYSLIKNIFTYFPNKIIIIEILNKSNISSKIIYFSLKFCKNLL
jgi:hypothetical protein